MEGRKRTVQVKFYVTEEERRLIREKMKLIPTRNMAAYLRKMAIDGYVVHIDTTDIRAQTAELQKIGVNVNQIARRLNSMGRCTHKMLRTSKERWRRYGSYKDTSYQVNAEKGIGLHRESGQDGRKNAGVLLCLLLRNRRHRI